MATYSSNTTIKIDSKANGTVSINGSGTSGVLFTVPANSYAIVNFQFNTSISSNIYPAHGLVDDKYVCVVYSVNATITTAEKSSQVLNLFVGPGSTFKIKNGYTSVAVFDWNYVLFSNTP